MRLCRLVVSFFFLVCLPLAGVSAENTPPKWTHERSDISVSPRASFGVLENGLRYVLVPNHTPPGQVSMRLLVLAGSLNELDDELGFAHFVEHMAFRSTRNFPADAKVKFLQSLGVGFGPHVNAETSSRHTLYRLDLPENSPATIDGAFKIMRDWADGIVFDAQEMDRERGVVLSEAADLHKSNGRLEAIYAGTLIVRRPPIGTDASIKKARASGLKGFYDAWYRPENVVVVVAGDFDPIPLAQALKDAFATLQGRGKTHAAPAMGTLTDASKPMTQFLSEVRNGVQSELGTIRIEATPPDTKASRFKGLELEMAHRMLRRRLQRLVNQPDPPIGGFLIDDSFPHGVFRQVSLFTVGNAYQWPTVLAKGEQELRRALELGFEASELRDVLEAFRGELNQMAVSSVATPTGALATEVVTEIENDRVFSFPDERLEQVLATLDQLTVAGCLAALRETWGQSPRYVFITASSQLIKPNPAQIRDKLRESAMVKVAPVATVEKPRFAYEDFGPPGVVAAREYIADLDVWQVRLANGVRVNLKKNNLERELVRLGVRIGSGRLGEPKDKPGVAAMAGMATLFGGLQKHSDDELERAMNGSHLNVNFTAEVDTFQMAVSSPARELPIALRLLTAFLTDAAFRATSNAKVTGNISDLYTHLETSADGVIDQRVKGLLSGDDPRLGFPPRKTMQKYSVENVAEWIRPVFKTDPIEVTVVGDFDIDAAIDQIARTLGTLAPRKPPADLTDLTKLHFPIPPIQKTFVYSTPDKSRPTTLADYWPVNVPLTQKDNARLQLLGQVLQERLRVQVRVEKGETYTPSAGVDWSDTYPGLANLHCRVDVKAASARKIGELIKAIAITLGREGATADELARVQAVATADVRRFKQSNDYWITVLTDSQEHPWRLDNARALEQDYATATLQEVNAVAARFLTAKNLCEFTIKPEYRKP